MQTNDIDEESRHWTMIIGEYWWELLKSACITGLIIWGLGSL